MGCVYHPNYDATKLCDQCQADLCDNCAFSLENGHTLCHRCMLALSLQDVKSEATRRKQAEEAQQLGLKKRYRPGYLHVLLAMGATLALLFVGLRFLWDQPVQRPQVVLDSSSPMVVLTKLQFALAQYATAHQDRYPDSLYDLLPDFLADTVQNRSLLRNFVYGLDARRGYVLRINKFAPFPGKELVVTAEDIRVAEEALSR
jgi:hypothetical protein